MKKSLDRRAEAVWLEDSKRWQIRVQSEGRRKAFYSSIPGRKGKRDAEAKADDWLETCTDDMRFDVAWADFLDYKRRTTGEANWAKIESLGRLWLLPNIATRRLSHITAHDWQSCINAAFEKGLSRRTCTNIRITIGTFMTYANLRAWSVDDCREKLTVPNGAPVGERTILQPPELVTLFTCNTIEHHTHPKFCRDIYAWRFIVLTGLRRGELCGLMWTDIEDGFMHIRRSINSRGIETHGKNDNARRTVILGQAAQAILDDQRAQLKRERILSKWVFPASDGDRMNSNALFNHWDVYRRQHGIKSTLHEMRHTFISVAGPYMPETLLKDNIGHSASMDTFGVYGHHVSGDDEVVRSAIDVAFEKVLRTLESEAR